MASGHLKAPRKQAEQMAAPISPAFTVKNPLPTGSRPQMARNFCQAHVHATESLPLKADVPADFDCFTPDSGRPWGVAHRGNCDPNRKSR
jgi:hypothetical protein